MESPASYAEWWFIKISIPNLLLIVGMITVFLLAVVAPFAHPTDDIGPDTGRD